MDEEKLPNGTGKTEDSGMRHRRPIIRLRHCVKGEVYRQVNTADERC